MLIHILIYIYQFYFNQQVMDERIGHECQPLDHFLNKQITETASYTL